MRQKKKPDIITVSIYGILALAGVYCVGSIGTALDLSLDDSGAVDFNLFSESLNTVMSDTNTVLSHMADFSSYAFKLSLVGVCVIAIYALMKVTDNRKFHRRGEEHGSARWANDKERKSLLDKSTKTNKSPRKGEFIPDNNIILTNDVKMSLNTRQTRKNLNVCVIGGSGSGKSRFYVKPNLMQCNTSYVVTDPKGELLRSTGKLLESQGYKIKVFNLINMRNSFNYNPFAYLYDVNGNYSETNVIKMINVLMKNTKQEGQSGGDQFWDDATKSLLASLSFYLVECESLEKQNFSEVMLLLKKAEVKEGDDSFESDLDIMFRTLEEENLKKPIDEQRDYMCLKYYKDFKKSAGETAKSILISTAVRLQAFNIPDVMSLTCKDTLHLENLGDEKQALFIIIPSSDDTFNFLVAMLYTQMFDVLYDRANFYYNGALKVHVRCMLDEFANIGTIPRFEELLATMRSMEISANVIIQNLSQLKKMYKDSWENVIGNCDSLLFLGGQEPTTLEHISKTLGKETIDLTTRSRSRGKNGSTSENGSIVGRELMTADELKVMKDNECILFVRGVYPFFSNKFVIEKHSNYTKLEDSDKSNAFDISQIQTEKFVYHRENEENYSEPVEDERINEVRANIEIGRKLSTQDVPSDLIIEDKKFDSLGEPVSKGLKPLEESIQNATIENSDTIVSSKPHINVDSSSYLDDYY